MDKVKKFAVVVLSSSNNGVTDIGTHIIDPDSKINTYGYPWALLDTLRQALNKYNVDEIIRLCRQLQSNKATHLAFDENQLNNPGIELRRHKRVTDALQIFKLNATGYPNSLLVYESLGETYRLMGNKRKTIANFEKARQLDPQNPHWKYVLETLTRKNSF